MRVNMGKSTSYTETHKEKRPFKYIAILIHTFVLSRFLKLRSNISSPVVHNAKRGGKDFANCILSTCSRLHQLAAAQSVNPIGRASRTRFVKYKSTTNRIVIIILLLVVWAIFHLQRHTPDASDLVSEFFFYIYFPFQATNHDIPRLPTTSGLTHKYTKDLF